MIKAQNTQTGSITAHWDTGDTDGWYAERRAVDGATLDNMKVQWPVDLDEYGEDDGAAVEAALREAWPEDTIEIR